MRQYSFLPIRHEHTTRLPQSLTLAIAVSGVTAIKTGAAKTAYNRASLAARTILGLWHKATGRTDPTLAAALAQAPDAAAQLRAILRRSHDENFPPEALGDRFEHFFEESTVIIPAAVLALHSGDLAGFGLWVDRSQRGAEKLLKNQVPETVALARSARALGAIASSAFGAGFGGSVWALVRAECAPEFQHQWEACYRDEFPGMGNSRFFCTRPGPPALSIPSQI
jgi:galactokinase